MKFKHEEVGEGFTARAVTSQVVLRLIWSSDVCLGTKRHYQMKAS